jgi:hypothetical protein
MAWQLLTVHHFQSTVLYCIVTATGFLEMLIISILYVVILIHCIQASIFDFEVIDGEGNTVNLSKYQDKKVIIIGIIN